MKITIYVDGAGTHWTARAYNDETEQHIWSSEDASSITRALEEISIEVWKFEREVEEVARLASRDSQVPCSLAADLSEPNTPEESR